MWKFLVQLLHPCSQVSTHLMVFYVPTFLGKQKTWRNLNKSTGASQHLCELFTVFVLRRSTRANWRGWGTAWSGGASSRSLPLLWTWTWLRIMQSEDLVGAMLQKGANETPLQDSIKRAAFLPSTPRLWWNFLVASWRLCYSSLNDQLSGQTFQQRHTLQHFLDHKSFGIT